MSLLMCKKCHVAIPGTIDGVSQHMHTQHTNKPFDIESKKLVKSLKALKPLDKLPDFNLEMSPIPPHCWAQATIFWSSVPWLWHI